jgi:molybdate transport system substrate-binding protein
MEVTHRAHLVITCRFMLRSPICSPWLRIWRILGVLCALGLGACAPETGQSAPLHVAAAASLQQVAGELALAFEQETGVQVRINCAGSNVLAKQIEAAGWAHVFLSADEEWLHYLSKKNYLWEQSSRSFLSNRMLLVAHPEHSLDASSWSELPDLDFEHLALASPESVPAGRYAKRLLEAARTPKGSYWELLEERIAPCGDVRAALAMVEATPSILGIVYASEAQRSTKALHTMEIPSELQPEIHYGAALVRHVEHPSAAQESAQLFMEFLSSEVALAIYRSNGFEVKPTQGLGAR